VLAGAPWLQITAGASGVLESPAVGGALVSLTLAVNTTQVEADGDDGAVGYVRVSGGAMPVYVAVYLQEYQRDYRYTLIPAFPTNLCAYNKSALPIGGGNAPQLPGTERAYLPLLWMPAVVTSIVSTC
jgi:hypothetical protein